MSYPYITDDNLERRQDYMYSAYHEIPFLKEYRETRTAFIGRIPPAPGVDMESIARGDGVRRSLADVAVRLSRKEWDDAAKADIDRWTKAFEIRKRLYDAYQENSIRPVDGAGYSDIPKYLLLSLGVFHAYSLSNSLKYFNCMLKVDDTLLSMEGGMSREEKEMLSMLLAKELSVFDRMVGNIGLEVDSLAG